MIVTCIPLFILFLFFLFSSFFPSFFLLFLIHILAAIDLLLKASYIIFFEIANHCVVSDTGTESHTWCTPFL